MSKNNNSCINISTQTSNKYSVKTNRCTPPRHRSKKEIVPFFTQAVKLPSVQVDINDSSYFLSRFLYHYLQIIISKFSRTSLSIAKFLPLLLLPNSAYSYPIFAQTAYESPIGKDGRIVCANCHVAQKQIDLIIPKAVLPDTIFQATVKVPYDTKCRQINSAGELGPLNIGAVLILPDGFELAPKDRLSSSLKAKTKGTSIQPYTRERKNILVVGPLSGDVDGVPRELTFPVLAPDPKKDPKLGFLAHSVYAGANMGRGQLYPSGERSNNNPSLASVAGKITSIRPGQTGTSVTIETKTGDVVEEKIQVGNNLIVDVGAEVAKAEPLTSDPNQGGFGQTEDIIVLQDPTRVKGYIVFSFSVILTQSLLVAKKRQVELVQRSARDL